MNQFDAIVCGGGMVGAAAALGLAQQGFDILMIEAGDAPSFSLEENRDLRISALSQGSVQLLETLGVWSAITAQRACPFYELSAWEDSNNSLTFTSKEINQPQLGFMVENRLIQWALWEKLKLQTNVKLLTRTQVIEFLPNVPKGYDVELDNGDIYQGQCILGADGGRSKVREALNIGSTAWQYRQDCLLIHVKTEQPQALNTWQQFRPEGPIAYLPLTDREASLVWYDSPEKIAELRDLSQRALRNEIMAIFPPLFGDIEIIQSASFPLIRHHAHRYFTRDALLLGDAAHTIHPMAGQGVNLGFRDVSAWLSLTQKQEEWTASLFLEYEKCRRRDNALMQTGMDLFYVLFRSNKSPIKMGRGALLNLANRGGVIKRKALKYALGME
jgi:2-octaprenyl-3-methyl-6-methoxy-1,4-benzoquinol hydroxylase